MRAQLKTADSTITVLQAAVAALFESDVDAFAATADCAPAKCVRCGNICGFDRGDG